MARGKLLCVGPTARLANGMTWDKLAGMSAADIKKVGAFPYPSLPHPLHANGGQVFPQMQVKMFPRLDRFDVEFDLPEAFVPEFPPAIFLQNRPELGDVSRGQVVHLGNFRDLFKEIMTPVQLGIRGVARGCDPRRRRSSPAEAPPLPARRRGRSGCSRAGRSCAARPG